MNKTRELEILRILYRERKMTVSEIAQAVFASEPSVRRDLASLESQRLIKRFHGGAMLESNGVSVMKNPYLVRELIDYDEKDRIAKKAASLVLDAHLIFMDASSSCLRMLPYLREKKDLTIITNSVKLLYEASNEYGIKVIGTGGVLSHDHFSMHGEEALRTIGSYYANRCFISCGGLDRQGRITSVFFEENQLRRAMLSCSVKSYLLCTSAKLTVRKSGIFADCDDVSGVITGSASDERLKHFDAKVREKIIGADDE